MKYKVGDRVRIRSKVPDNEQLLHDYYAFTSDHYDARKYMGRVMTIDTVSDLNEGYRMEEDSFMYFWPETMIEGFAMESGWDSLTEEEKGYLDHLLLEKRESVRQTFIREEMATLLHVRIRSINKLIHSIREKLFGKTVGMTKEQIEEKLGISNLKIVKE